MSEENEPNQDPPEEPPAELEGQTSINEHLVELGEKPVLKIEVREPTDEEISAFLTGETDRGQPEG